MIRELTATPPGHWTTRERFPSEAGPAFSPVISPDGREIAYHAFREGTRQVFVVASEGGRPIAVTVGAEHHRGPRWSPDGRRLTIATADRTGALETDVVSRDHDGRWSAPRTLVKGGTNGAWSPDGDSIVTFLAGERGGLVIVPAAGGRPRMLVPLPSATMPQFTWSEDGRFVYYLARDPEDNRTGIWRVPRAGGAPRIVFRFDDPSRPWHRSGFKVRGGRFYVTLGDQQSDIWMMDVVGSR